MMVPTSEIDPASAPDGVRGLLFRRSIYALLIAVAAGMMIARIARVESSDPKSQTPFLSANDRSRWATIRSLGDNGTYVIDHVIFDKKGNRVRGWHTIDLVRHQGSDGKEHYYSSKPTLLTTLLAGEYWVVKQLTGASLAEQPGYVSRLMLILTNVLPLAGALWLLSRLIDEFGTTDWGRVFAVAAACFGTFITTYSVTLNNHSVAAISLVFAVAVSVPIFRVDCRAWWRFAVAGLSFGFLAANELPALSLFALAGVGLAWKSPLQTIAAFAPAAALVAVAAFGTNWLAHGDWRTPYAHRKDGPIIATVGGPIKVPEYMEQLNAGRLPEEMRLEITEDGVEISAKATIKVVEPFVRWMYWDEQTQTRLAIVDRDALAGRSAIDICKWDNWYDYEGSYWLKANLRGIDVGESSPLVYAFNCLIGHHGLFSLTPIWLLSVVGCFAWLTQRNKSPLTTHHAPPHFVLAATTLLISAVILAFYLTRPQIDRNYGGGTCCLRWLIWLTPLWLLTLLPTVDRLGKSQWGRTIAITLLVVSVFSAAYATDNPWSHPWIFDYWTSMGWIEY